MKSRALFAALLLGACSGQVSTNDGPSDQANIYRKPVGNGPALNGNQLAVSSYGSETHDVVWIEGGELVGWVDGGVVRGLDMIGAVLYGYSAPYGNEQETMIHVTDVIGPLDGDLYEYRVERADGSPLCDPGVLAVVLSGSWNYGAGFAGGGDHNDDGSFTFGCANRALGKCLEGGYKPWYGPAYADLHQACTRMMRADYCGNGVSATRDGVPIDMYDNYGIETPNDDATFSLESTWSGPGAQCVSRTRIAAVNRFISEANGIPVGGFSGTHVTFQYYTGVNCGDHVIQTCEENQAWGPLLVNTQNTSTVVTYCFGFECESF